MKTLCKVCTINDWNDLELTDMMLEVFPKNPPFHPSHIMHFEPKDKPVMHRKLWEWAVGMLTLKSWVNSTGIHWD